MKPILQPGIRVPKLTMIAVNEPEGVSIGDPIGPYTVLLFFPAKALDGQMEQLSKFEARVSDFAAQNARVIGVSDARADALARAAQEGNITFALASDPDRLIAADLGVVSGDAVLPTAFIVDEEGLIRRSFESGASASLPNPAAVIRAINTATQAPKPPPATEKDWRSGPVGAPVAMVEYADYQCGHCQELYEVVKRVLPAYRDCVSLVFRHFPLKHSHPLAPLAAEAAEAAGAQGKFWEMHGRLFEAKNALEREKLLQYAREIGLDVDKFTRDLDGGVFKSAVEEDFRGATGNRIKFPPTLFVNGILYDGPRTADAICARIDTLLACVRKRD